MNRADKFYITTAIDYPSGKPHIGHAYEKILGDVLARRQRRRGRRVFFLTGTDEHGQKIEKYARAAGKDPQTFVDEMSRQFIDFCRRFDVSYDDFIRTTQPRHIAASERIFKTVYDRGDIYRGTYEGSYCVDCETFYLDRDLREGCCPVHGKKAERVKQEGYFFALSRYRQAVLEKITSGELLIFPQSRRNEIISRIKEGVRDLSVSRANFTWGIPLPNDRAHVIFVWFDALVNYISALGWPDGERFREFWPADVHLIGKDILWFHAMVWPAILLAAGLALPRCVCVHGFINAGGEKVSKSKGMIVDPVELAGKYGADSLRYFLLRDTAFGEDGNFSEEALVGRINSDLANDLGNLVYRTLTMLEKYCAGRIPRNYSENTGAALLAAAGELEPAVDRELEKYDFSAALERIWTVINAANKFIEDTKPWNLFKEKKAAELNDFLFALARAIASIEEALDCFLPQTAEKIRRQFAGGMAHKEPPLFPRIENAR